MSDLLDSNNFPGSDRFSLAAQESLTLSEAVARALENNPDLAVDAPGQQAAHLEFKAARAGYLPRLDFEQSYWPATIPFRVWTPAEQQKFTAENFALPALNSPSPIDNLQTRATVQQTIWDFGRTRNRREQAGLGVKMADQSHEEHKRQVLLEVFQQLLRDVARQHFARDGAMAWQFRSPRPLRIRQARVDSGLAVEADLLRSRVYLSTARQQEIQAQGQLESARAQLNRVMGDSLNKATGETNPLLPATISLPREESLVAEQKQRRPDYQNLLTELQEAEAAVRASRRNSSPWWPDTPPGKRTIPR